MARKRTIVLISGRGSNMMSLVEAAQSPDYPAEIVAVFANRPDAAGLGWAASRGLPTRLVDHRAFPDRKAFETALHAELSAVDAEIVCLAGFMRILSGEFVARWHGRLINIHPSLLPAFKGLRTHEQALEAGVRIAGCTVHFVVPEMDAGPIIAQAAVPVGPNDTVESLAQRVLTAEHRLYPHALRCVALGQAWMADGHAMFSGSGLGVNQDDVVISPPLF